MRTVPTEVGPRRGRQNPSRDLSIGLAEVRRGRPVLLQGPGSVGSLVFAAQHVGPDMVNFLIREAGGLVCLCLPPSEARRLDLHPIDRRGTHGWVPSFTALIEARAGVGTGISATDRAVTIAVAADPTSAPEDLVSPGHVQPIVADPEDVGVGGGQPEAAVALMDLAGVRPLAVSCAVLDEDGEVAGPDALAALADRSGVVVVSIEQVERARGGG